MNYPVTDAYLADLLHRAAEALRVMRPGLAESLTEVSRYFDLSDSFAQLTAVNQDIVAAYAHELVERERSARRAGRTREDAE